MVSDTDGAEKGGAGSRRRFAKGFKREVVQETLAPGASVAGVALKHRLNANLVFTWRRRLMPTLAPAKVRPAKLLPVTIAESSATLPSPAGESIASNKTVRRYRVRGAIEIELNGARLVLKGTVDIEALRVVLAALLSR
jgi:transposase